LLDNQFTMVNFFDWLDEELDQRGWLRADLAKRAKISESGLSMAYSGKRGVGTEMLTAIAGALNLPQESVFRAAGLLPAVDELDELRAQIMEATKGMSRAEQREVLNYIRFRRGLDEDKSQDAPVGKLAKQHK
jgi:transcriptional regulator with XRE-family HTH domain